MPVNWIFVLFRIGIPYMLWKPSFCDYRGMLHSIDSYHILRDLLYNMHYILYKRNDRVTRLASYAVADTTVCSPHTAAHCIPIGLAQVFK